MTNVTGQLADTLEEFMARYESDYFTLAAVDGRVLADWTTKASAALRAYRDRPEDAELEARIEAAKRRIGDLKACHTRWRESPENQSMASATADEMERIAYSVLCYLDGEPGPYRGVPDIPALKPITRKCAPFTSPEFQRYNE